MSRSAPNRRRRRNPAPAASEFVEVYQPHSDRSTSGLHGSFASLAWIEAGGPKGGERRAWAIRSWVPRSSGSSAPRERVEFGELAAFPTSRGWQLTLPLEQAVDPVRLPPAALREGRGAFLGDAERRSLDRAQRDLLRRMAARWAELGAGATRKNPRSRNNPEPEEYLEEITPYDDWSLKQGYQSSSRLVWIDPDPSERGRHRGWSLIHWYDRKVGRAEMLLCLGEFARHPVDAQRKWGPCNRHELQFIFEPSVLKYNLRNALTDAQKRELGLRGYLALERMVRRWRELGMPTWTRRP